MLDAARRDGVRDDAVRLLAHAGLAHRTKVALGHLGLTEMTHTQAPLPPADRPHAAPPATSQEPPRHLVPAPRPPHEAMIIPAADDPQAAVELYSRHPETVHRALTGCPHDETLSRLIDHATSATSTDGTDPGAVRVNAARLAGFPRRTAARNPRVNRLASKRR